MRRLAIATLSAALVFSACNEDTREPTSPEPLFNAACQVTPFPHNTVVKQIKDVFPPGLRGKAVVSSAAIKNHWNGCRPAPARQGVLEFIEEMNSDQEAGLLVGTEAERNALVITLLSGVGLFDLPITPGADFGIGYFDPDSPDPLLVKTASGQAIGEVPAGSFTVFTVIVLSRKPDATILTDFDGNQFPPFYDYTAINSLNDHVFGDEENPLFGIVAFCFVAGFEYPDEVRIGHNPVEGAPGFPFEILDPVDLFEDRADLRAELNCPPTNNTGGEIGSFGAEFLNFSRAPWSTTGIYAASLARALFLPTPLRAATVEGLGPLSGKTRSYSPFGVVEESENEIEDANSRVIGSGEDGPYFVGQQLDPCGECSVEFRVTDRDGEPVGGIPVTVSLVPEGGGLSGTLTDDTSEDGIARFGNLVISEPGTYQLRVTAPNATPYLTDEFTVYEYRLEFSSDPSGQSMGFPHLSWYCGDNCYPEVRLVDGAGNGVGGVQVTVELLQTEGGSGEIDTDLSTTLVTTSSGEGIGYAVFDDLHITEQGYYRLRFTAPGAPDLVSETFSALSFD